MAMTAVCTTSPSPCARGPTGVREAPGAIDAGEPGAAGIEAGVICPGGSDPGAMLPVETLPVETVPDGTVPGEAGPGTA